MDISFLTADKIQAIFSYEEIKNLDIKIEDLNKPIYIQRLTFSLLSILKDIYNIDFYEQNLAVSFQSTGDHLIVEMSRDQNDIDELRQESGNHCQDNGIDSEELQEYIDNVMSAFGWTRTNNASNSDRRIHPVRHKRLRKRPHDIEENFTLYEFDSLDDVINISEIVEDKRLKMINTTDFAEVFNDSEAFFDTTTKEEEPVPKTGINTCLYKDKAKGKYILVVETGKEDEAFLDSVSPILAEFSNSSERISALRKQHLLEFNDVIVKDNVFEKLGNL